MVTKFQKNRERIGLVIYGQSNEAMAVPVTDKAAYPLAFASQKTTGRAVPIGPAKGMTGGWWWYVHDEMWDRGYDLQIANAGIGSLSFLNQASTVTKTWAANQPYYAGRNATGQDFGDFGDVLSVNSGSAFFRCITGNVRTAFSNGGLPDGSGLTGSTSYIRATTNLVSGNTQPNWASITTNPTGLTDGGTITDGGLVWQRVPNSWYNNRLGSSLRYQFHSGHGFDPLGTMDRALECAKNMRDVTRKIVYIQNAQSDLSNSSVAYSNTLIAIAEYFLMHNLEVMIGLSCWGGNASNSTTTNYNNLSAAVVTAIQTLQAQYPGKVWSGANLYQAMGTTGPMAARTFNGTISNNVLTDNNSLPSGGAWGGQFEVGMKLYDSAGTYYGQIASFGTGTGGAGTYNLTGGVNVTNWDLRAVGAFLSGVDAVHLNGAGAVGPAVSNVSCAGKHVTDAFAAILPDRRPLIVDQYGNAA